MLYILGRCNKRVSNVFQSANKEHHMPVAKGTYLAAALLAMSWSAAATELNWVGCNVSRTAYVDDLAQAYQQKTGTHIELKLASSTQGIRDVQSGAADLGSSTRYQLVDDPREAGVEFVPVAWDALAIIVHKDNPLTDISLDQLRDIYRGKITNWKQLGGADHEIEVLIQPHGNTAEGSTLREIIFSDVNARFTTGRLLNANDSVVQLLVDNPYAIAVTGISHARKPDIKIVALDGVSPTVASLKRGDYALYRPLYLTYNPNSAQVDAIKNFISYINSKDARDIMRTNGVVPYTEAMGLVMKKVYENEASYPQSVDNI